MNGVNGANFAEAGKTWVIRAQQAVKCSMPVMQMHDPRRQFKVPDIGRRGYAQKSKFAGVAGKRPLGSVVYVYPPGTLRREQRVLEDNVAHAGIRPGDLDCHHLVHA